mgnify:CR=1 FL=1
MPTHRSNGSTQRHEQVVRRTAKHRQGACRYGSQHKAQQHVLAVVARTQQEYHVARDK